MSRLWLQKMKDKCTKSRKNYQKSGKIFGIKNEERQKKSVMRKSAVALKQNLGKTEFISEVPT